MPKGKTLSIFLCLVFISCAGSFNQRSYKTLATAAYTYDATMRTVADLYQQGHIDESGRAQITSAAAIFWSYYHTALNALEYHIKTSGDSRSKREVQEKIDGMIKKQGEVTTMVGALTP
tara:strand:- start:5270 stop:5626 length:357 start_codon:yes stop_codon:yes gene_type:complete